MHVRLVSHHVLTAPETASVAWCISSDRQPMTRTFGTNAKPEEGT